MLLALLVAPSSRRHCTRYAARVFPQSPLQEHVDGMGEAVFSLLRVRRCCVVCATHAWVVLCLL